ncbi:MAG TPA: PAS domain-containing protein, partial [Candidatus Wallbacteria bacterium]|nr:PAS domain-containing protein [Candidatus Wallbacteria bacterium]
MNDQDNKSIHQIEEELKKSEAQKNAILNGITTNIAFVDKNLNIIWVNKAAAESVKKTPQEMVGRACHFRTIDEFWFVL